MDNEERYCIMSSAAWHGIASHLYTEVWAAVVGATENRFEGDVVLPVDAAVRDGVRAQIELELDENNL